MSEETKPDRTLTGLRPKASAGDVQFLMRRNRPEPPQEPTEAAMRGLAASLRMVDVPEESDQVAESETRKRTDSVSNKLTKSVTNRVPKYLQLKRREARIYDNQADELTALTRRLNDQRKQSDGTTAGERITDNTLVRLAIDLLLERKQELSGATEEELARSLGLAYRHKTTTD